MCGSYSSRSSIVHLCRSRSDKRRESLDRLRREIAVGHRVADGDDALAGILEGARDRAGGLGLADPGPHGRHRHGGNRRLEHRGVGPEQHEVGAGRHHDRGLVHHVLVLDVGVAEHDVVDVELPDQAHQLGLVVDLDAVRVVRTRERRRVAPVVDERDLGGGERDDVRAGVLAKHGVEVVEVAAGGSHDQYTSGHTRILSAGRCLMRGRPGPRSTLAPLFGPTLLQALRTGPASTAPVTCGTSGAADPRPLRPPCGTRSRGPRSPGGSPRRRTPKCCRSMYAARVGHGTGVGQPGDLAPTGAGDDLRDALGVAVVRRCPAAASARRRGRGH